MSDPNFSSVSLLVHFDGTNGSTSYTDTSTIAHTVGSTGTAALTTSTPQWGTASLNPGTGGAIVATPGTSLQLSGDFTVEGWAQTSVPTTSNNMVLIAGSSSASAVDPLGVIVIFSGNTLEGGCEKVGGSDGFCFGTASPGVNTWFHWAYTRSGNNFQLWYNGVQCGSTATVAATVAAITDFTIGYATKNSAGTFTPWVGKIDDVRVTKGVARYTSGFTPPTAAFDDTGPTGSTGTAAVTQNANTDAATGTVAISGTAAVTQQKNVAFATSPISGTAAVTQNANIVAAAGGTGAFTGGTAATTQNPNTAAGTGTVLVSGTAATTQNRSTTTTAGGPVVSGSATPTQQKNIAAGIASPPLTGSAAITQNPNLAFAYNTTLHAAGVQPMDVFAPYAHANGGTSEPTDPYFGSVVLSLHMDWGIAGTTVIPDASNSHKCVEAFGNAATNPSGSSLAGAGMMGVTSGGLVVTDPVDFNFNADFTVEGWAKTSTPSTSMYLVANLVTSDDTTSAGPQVLIDSGQLKALCFDTTGLGFGNINGGTIPSNTWFHFAYSRVGTSLKLYLNGTQVGSTVTSSTTCKAGTALIIGNHHIIGGAFYQWFGNMDEIRITRGIGRYTSNFTPTAALWPDQGALTGLSAVATQTVDPFIQSAAVFGAGFRSAAAAQTMAAYPQVYLVSAPSRVVSGATTFAFAQTATVITTADRNLITPGDAYYPAVAYLLHGDASTSSGGAHYYTDNSKNNWNIQGALSTTITTDSLAYGGKAIAFTPTASSAIFNFSYDTGTVFDFTLSTTEMRVRFDTLNGVLPGTPDPSNPGQYTFDATAQQTGWFFSSGNGAGAIRLGLAGHNGAFEADWSSITLFGTSIDFSPYVLQIKGFVFQPSTATFASVNVFGVLPVTTGWHNVTVERNGGNVSVYLDGVFDFTFAIGETAAGFFDGSFITGGDITQGFAFHPEHTNLSAVEEMRHTWGVNRYGHTFTPTTVAFPNGQIGLVPPITQVAAATTGAIVRQVAGAQTVFQIIQAATVFGQGPRSAAAAQTIPAFTQAASCYGQGQRTGSATQFLPPFIQVATVAPPRYVEAFAQYMLPIPQAGTITTGRTVNAAQALTIRQAATVIHSVDHVTIASTFVFGQVATASAILKLTAGQIFPNFGQAAAVTSTHRLVANQLVAPFIPSTLVQSSFVGSSERTYAVRGESRVCTPLYTVP